MTNGNRPRCGCCGRFLKRYVDGWRCVKVFYDNYAGGWEHW